MAGGCTAGAIRQECGDEECVRPAAQDRRTATRARTAESSDRWEGQRLKTGPRSRLANHLHSDQVRDRFSGMPVYNGTPCQIEAIPH